MSSERRDERRQIRAFLRPGYARPFWVLVALLLLLGGARLALTPWVAEQIRAEIDRQPAMRATFSDLALFGFPPCAVLTDVKIEDFDGRRVLSVPRVEVHATWKDLKSFLRRSPDDPATPAVRVRMEDPDLIVRSADPERAISDVGTWLASFVPLRPELLAVDRGRVLAGVGDGPAGVCAHDIDVSVDQLNMSKRLALMASTPACRALASPTVQHATALELSPDRLP